MPVNEEGTGAAARDAGTVGAEEAPGGKGAQGAEKANGDDSGSATDVDEDEDATQIGDSQMEGEVDEGAANLEEEQIQQPQPENAEGEPEEDDEEDGDQSPILGTRRDREESPVLEAGRRYQDGEGEVAGQKATQDTDTECVPTQAFEEQAVSAAAGDAMKSVEQNQTRKVTRDTATHQATGRRTRKQKETQQDPLLDQDDREMSPDVGETVQATTDVPTQEYDVSTAQASEDQQAPALTSPSKSGIDGPAEEPREQTASALSEHVLQAGAKAKNETLEQKENIDPAEEEGRSSKVPRRSGLGKEAEAKEEAPEPLPQISKRARKAAAEEDNQVVEPTVRKKADKKPAPKVKNEEPAAAGSTRSTRRNAAAVQAPPDPREEKHTEEQASRSTRKRAAATQKVKTEEPDQELAADAACATNQKATAKPSTEKLNEPQAKRGGRKGKTIVESVQHGPSEAKPELESPQRATRGRQLAVKEEPDNQAGEVKSSAKGGKRENNAPAVQEATSVAGSKRKREPDAGAEDSSVPITPDPPKKKAAQAKSSARSQSTESVEAPGSFSPGARKSKAKKVIAFSKIEGAGLEKAVAGLHGIVGKAGEDFSHLVMKRLAFTPKLAVAICKGNHILSEDWIWKSSGAGVFLNEGSFILKDPEFEKEWEFNLKESIRKANQREALLFQGLKFFRHKDFKIPDEECKMIVEGAGGKFLKKEEKGKDVICLVATDAKPNRNRQERDVEWLKRVILRQEVPAGEGE